jgi:hypothetical protein
MAGIQKEDANDGREHAMRWMDANGSLDAFDMNHYQALTERGLPAAV